MVWNVAYSFRQLDKLCCLPDSPNSIDTPALDTLSMCCSLWGITSPNSIHQRIPRSQYWILEILLSLLMQHEPGLQQHILAADQLRVCQRHRIFISRMRTARVVCEEHGYKSAQGLGRIATAPVVGVEHVTDFGGADGTYEADDTRSIGVGIMEKLDSEVPIVIWEWQLA
jgi:hypothetical protein